MPSVQISQEQQQLSNPVLVVRVQAGWQVANQQHLCLQLTVGEKHRHRSFQTDTAEAVPLNNRAV